MAVFNEQSHFFYKFFILEHSRIRQKQPFVQCFFFKISQRLKPCTPTRPTGGFTITHVFKIDFVFVNVSHFASAKAAPKIVKEHVLPTLKSEQLRKYRN
tara:strand:+ start:2284 stop:2580 length:297 start_codon:yes stop_codon:yes gene_type:complete